MISTERFATGDKAAITDGTTKVTFDYPSDFADWLAGHPEEDQHLRRWQWVIP
jgi:hypothetical protein